ncbi:MAG TPA: GNAT family N-acetyltransferase [Candidatus Dormibacteraeota bacterium]|nr:GNAT family N-acetyltransferase [Candidatus Dormibacteraeota bacterium]
MRWRATSDVDEYATAVGAFLEAEPCSRNVPRWIIELARRGIGGWVAAPHFWWLDDDGAVLGAASWTPPYNLIVTDLPSEGASQLVDAVRSYASGRPHRVAGVTGPRPAADAVADAWRARTGDAVALHMAQLMHELTEVRPVATPEGSRRLAGAADLDQMTEWMVAFATEVRVPAGSDPRQTTATLIADRNFHVWTVDGRAVSMAGRRELIAGVVRVGPVYTPPSHRGRGYARRLVAEMSQEALESEGAQRCMLYTDIANPVSNEIYRQIGYRPVEEHADFAFGDGAT